ncbi:MAG: hypothetical protein HDT44_11835 [Ruminococcaceae bacterium]|nr:hypothetical protein [Oscillospiraceae bacterium]
MYFGKNKSGLLFFGLPIMVSAIFMLSENAEIKNHIKGFSLQSLTAA